MDVYKILAQVAPKDTSNTTILYTVPKTEAKTVEKDSIVTTGPKAVVPITQTVISSIVVTNIDFPASRIYSLYLLPDNTTTPDVAGGGTNGGKHNLVYSRTLTTWNVDVLDFGLVLPPEATLRCISDSVAVEDPPEGLTFTVMGIETTLQ